MINKSIIHFYEKLSTSNINKPVESMTSLALIATLSSVATPPTTFPVVPPPIKNSENIVKKASKHSNVKKSYAQTSKTNILSNIEDVLQIKEAFLFLSANEVGRMIKAKSSKDKKKPKINMMTKGPLRKQVIVPMAKLNTELIVNLAYQHIANINKCLKNIKSDIIANFI